MIYSFCRKGVYNHIRACKAPILFAQGRGFFIVQIKNKSTQVKIFICMDNFEKKEDDFIFIGEVIERGRKLLAEGNREFIDSKIDNEKLASLVFTSGTTASSKAVMLSQNNIASNVYAMQLVERFYSTDINLAFLPFHHIFGSTEMIVMLEVGLTTAFPDGLRYVAQNLKEYKVSVFVGVPLLVEAIYKKIEEGIEKQGKTKLVNVAKKISNLLLKWALKNLQVIHFIFFPVPKSINSYN